MTVEIPGTQDAQAQRMRRRARRREVARDATMQAFAAQALDELLAEFAEAKHSAAAQALLEQLPTLLDRLARALELAMEDEVASIRQELQP
jgi:hypothetical protein